MPTESLEEDLETLRLPKNWRSSVRHAVLHVIGIVRMAMLAGRQALIDNGDAKDARIHQPESEVAMLRESYGSTVRECSVSPRTRRRAIRASSAASCRSILATTGAQI
jgi:hypothetical protein